VQLARIIVNELDVARFDPLLTAAVMKIVLSSIDLLLSRADSFASIPLWSSIVSSKVSPDCQR
jgi:hypothetical protein